MPITSIQRDTSFAFTRMFAEAETHDEFHIARVKIEIAEQIYRMMEERKVTQAELARRLGKNRAYISRILKGTTNFTIETLVKIGRQLVAEWEFHLSDAEKPAKASKPVKTKKKVS